MKQVESCELKQKAFLKESKLYRKILEINSNTVVFLIYFYISLVPTYN